MPEKSLNESVTGRRLYKSLALGSLRSVTGRRLPSITSTALWPSAAAVFCCAGCAAGAEAPQAETASAVSAVLNSKSNFFIGIPPFYLYSLIIKSAGHGV